MAVPRGTRVPRLALPTKRPLELAIACRGCLRDSAVLINVLPSCHQGQREREKDERKRLWNITMEKSKTATP